MVDEQVIASIQSALLSALSLPIDWILMTCESVTCPKTYPLRIFLLICFLLFAVTTFGTLFEPDEYEAAGFSSMSPLFTYAFMPQSHSADCLQFLCRKPKFRHLMSGMLLVGRMNLKFSAAWILDALKHMI